MDARRRWRSRSKGRGPAPHGTAPLAPRRCAGARLTAPTHARSTASAAWRQAATGLTSPTHARAPTVVKPLPGFETWPRRVEEDQRQLEAQRVQDTEDYNILKIKLETEIQTLEQQLEEMRATYQLNQEKLDYNYRVLVERDSENTNTIKQQKKKLTRMADVLSSLKAKCAPSLSHSLQSSARSHPSLHALRPPCACPSSGVPHPTCGRRYAREERRYKQENQDLTEEYKRITEQFKDLQNKFQHFEVADTNRYRDVWQMNEEAITELMRKARLRAAPARRALGAAIRVAPPP